VSAVLQFPEIKKRRISDKDWKRIEEYVKREQNKRETASFRKLHEKIWAEVDRQVYMRAPKKINHDPKNKNDWHAAIELGELSRASETMTADVIRLAFPTNRSWFEAHSEIQADLDPQTGQNVAPKQEDQQFIDGALRALMTQQHLDFGFQDRIELSVKEAIHHGSFVAEARQESALLVHEGSGIQSLSSPVWVPHSMWNCYPDPSPAALSTNMFYTGSMIIKEYMPLYKLKEVANKGSEQGWMASQLSKIPKRRNKNKDIETEDVELVKYFGDCVIDRNDGDIFLPNSKIILANGVIVFYAPNKLSFPNIIYSGYEKLDVRDSYYISPLMKLAPMHKVATVLANKFLDAIALHTEPPLIYDANDPAFVMNGGPVIAPGARTATKGTAEFKTAEIGDPKAALAGLQFAVAQVKQGTGDELERESGEETATKSRLKNMKDEVRTVKFVARLEFTLKIFLYMQHEINKQDLEAYSFYNPEMDAPDHMRVTRDQLPQNVNFEIVGSRGILGEQERAEKTSVVISFASQNPLFANLLKAPDILKEMLQDAGVKSPERFLNIPTDETQQIEQRVEDKYKQIIQEGMQEIDDLNKKLAISKAVNDARLLEAQLKAESQAAIAEYKAQIQSQVDVLKSQLAIAESAAKQAGDHQKNVNQMSIKEIGDVIGALEKLIDSQKSEQEKRSNEVTQKIEALASTTETLLKEIKKPVKLKDASGKVLKTASRD
jgi:hypothetical protein